MASDKKVENFISKLLLKPVGKLSKESPKSFTLRDVSVDIRYQLKLLIRDMNLMWDVTRALQLSVSEVLKI